MNHSFFLWGSYGAALLVFVVEIALVRRRRKEALRSLRLERAAGEEE